MCQDLITCLTTQNTEALSAVHNERKKFTAQESPYELCICMRKYVQPPSATLNSSDHANQILIQSPLPSEDKMSIAHREDKLRGEHHGWA